VDRNALAARSARELQSAERLRERKSPGRPGLFDGEGGI
jgi:hypothetical protein